MNPTAQKWEEKSKRSNSANKQVSGRGIHTDTNDVLESARESKRTKCNVFRTGPVIEPEKLSVHGSLVGPAVEPLSNR